jgi:hypothetical protein
LRGFRRIPSVEASAANSRSKSATPLGAICDRPSKPSYDYCQEAGRLSVKPLSLVRCFVTAQPLHKPLAAYVRVILPPHCQYPPQAYQPPRFSFSPSARSAQEISSAAGPLPLAAAMPAIPPPPADGVPPSLCARNGPCPRNSPPAAPAPHSLPPQGVCRTCSRPRRMPEKPRLSPCPPRAPAGHRGPTHGFPPSARSVPPVPQAAPQKAVSRTPA